MSINRGHMEYYGKNTNKVVLYKDPDYKKNSYYIDTEEEYYTVDDIKTLSVCWQRLLENLNLRIMP